MVHYIYISQLLQSDNTAAVKLSIEHSTQYRTDSTQYRTDSTQYRIDTTQYRTDIEGQLKYIKYTLDKQNIYFYSILVLLDWD